MIAWQRKRSERELSHLVRKDCIFLDSGNYHYLTKLWLELVKEPFELLVFDHHTDMQRPAFGGILSCGGWIREALETNENLKHVILVGPPETAMEETKRELLEDGEELIRKVTWISEEEFLQKCGKAGWNKETLWTVQRK